MYPNMVPGEQKENAHFRYRGPVKAPVDMRIPVGPKIYEFFCSHNREQLVACRVLPLAFQLGCTGWIVNAMKSVGPMTAIAG